MNGTKRQEQSDRLFSSIAQLYPEGSTILLEAFVDYLSRKTDFFIGRSAGKWEKLVVDKFKKGEKINKELQLNEESKIKATITKRQADESVGAIYPAKIKKSTEMIQNRMYDPNEPGTSSAISAVTEDKRSYNRAPAENHQKRKIPNNLTPWDGRKGKNVVVESNYLETLINGFMENNGSQQGSRRAQEQGTFSRVKKAEQQSNTAEIMYNELRGNFQQYQTESNRRMQFSFK